ncbi:MAG: peptidoglycan bridge formation glycyltransferase FemA/FemB family protein [Candidatus Dormibacteraeota bacterium]|nr:peptidoglycan bridge formation glycyltransferase FemA/FemB family protein [Candidatus Dormibacteraeota bacterium]
MPGADWDDLLARLGAPTGPAPLLQSHGFGQVQAEEGWRVERVRLPGVAFTALLQARGRLASAYLPRGPVPAEPPALAAVAAWARERGLARLRVEPDAGPELAVALQELGFSRAVATQPDHTLIVPLGDEEAMLASFKPKHRYNIRLAERRGVTVAETDDAEELERQARATAGRQGIILPDAAGFQRRLRHLGWSRIYVARYEGEALAAILVARFGGRAYYLFGGSSGAQRALQPAYAAQWAAMRAAAAAGCRDYDLWGLPPTADPDHPWAGLWQFKIGFGGEHVTYCGAWDLALRRRLARAGEIMARVERAALLHRR